MSDEPGAAAPAPATTTESGATTMTVSPWMTAALVAAYATRAMWVKLRSAAGKRKPLKNCQDKPLEQEEDGNDSDSDSEAEAESQDDAQVAPVKQDPMLMPIQSDAGPIARSIEL